jgi:hypothetical protein
MITTLPVIAGDQTDSVAMAVLQTLGSAKQDPAVEPPEQSAKTITSNAAKSEVVAVAHWAVLQTVTLNPGVLSA